MASFDFSGKQVLVTGASRGIGYAVATAFAHAGADVNILADDMAIHKAAKSLSALVDCTVTAQQCDITERRAVEEAIALLDHIDVLVNNAGLELITPIEDSGYEVEAIFRRIVEINVMGTYYVTRDALAKMGPGGKIIFTASMWGKTAVAEFSAYCASKHANIGFMRSLAQELAPRGINVNAVCPGWVHTQAAMRSLKVMAERHQRSEKELLAEIVGAQAMDGLMEPEDIVGAYLYLASEAAANITGQAIDVNRGELMG